MNPALQTLTPELILAISMLLSISLAIYSGWRPMAIIPSYFLILSLFFEGGNLAHFFGFQFGPSLTFIAVTTSVLLMRRWWRWRKRKTFGEISVSSFMRTSPVVFLIAFIISIILPVVWHFAMHGVVLGSFLKIQVFALWAIIMFIIAHEEIDYENFRLHCTVFGLILLALYVPQSVMLYEMSDGLGLGRLRRFEVLRRYDQYWADIHLIQISYKNIWFQMNLMGSFAFAILSAGIASYFFESLYQKKNTKQAVALGAILLFEYYIIYINQYFLLVVIFNSIVLSSILAAFVYRKKLPMGIGQFYAYSALLIVICVAIVYVTLKPPEIRSEQFEYSSQLELSEQLVKGNRLTRIARGFDSLVTDCFWTGCSNESAKSTGHSDILDRMIEFGVLFGLLSNFISLYFLWWLFRKNTFARFSYGEYVFTLNMLITMALCSLGGIFSGQQANLALMVAVGILWLRALNMPRISPAL